MKVEFQGVVPSLRYENANAMLDWLVRVFGFEEIARYVDKDGKIRQAELCAGGLYEIWVDGKDPGYWEKLGDHPKGYVVVWVSDVDAMHARVVAAGAEATPPTDKTWGARTTDVRDPEGYLWCFLRRLPQGYQQVRSPEEGGLVEIKGSAAIPAR